jgi:hypothetical protein
MKKIILILVLFSIHMNSYALDIKSATCYGFKLESIQFNMSEMDKSLFSHFILIDSEKPLDQQEHPFKGEIVIDWSNIVTSSKIHRKFSLYIVPRNSSNTKKIHVLSHICNGQNQRTIEKF